MTDAEVREFLAAERTMQCVSIGPNGRPHLMPLWYVPDGVELSCWTFAKSQKARNLERDPRATVGVDTGVEYNELRGVMMECDVELERDTAHVAEFGRALFTRYGGGGQIGEEVAAMVEQQAAKRVALRFHPTRIVTWDHGKLGGVY